MGCENVGYEELARDRIAHDLKNQLGIILGFAELFLKDFSGDDPRRADVQEMHKATRAALTLVSQLSSAADDGR